MNGAHTHTHTSRRIVEPGHVHCVSVEASTVDAFVVHDVSVKAVIVPHFGYVGVFEPLFKLLQNPFRLAQVIDLNNTAWSIPEIRVWSAVNRRTNHLFIHRILSRGW